MVAVKQLPHRFYFKYIYQALFYMTQKIQLLLLVMLICQND
ncbi:putative membrane protein [Yersinia pseudotuberculosis IP 32953]|nr:putative membrane protein [Yersinia pseudotuberculosis]AJJ54892.1 putative membrane protein [Yersinia pseudotuberculosis IP 32953]CQD58951.1 Uncharacterised protein [Yersinia intermedia]AJJ04823.1 putative membrane protein [Yersinia pseudotuberculosis]AJJ72622.1 putative membrane protein [Yersinia pseudotuberculosis]